MFVIQYFPDGGSSGNMKILRTLAQLPGWKAELNNRTLFLKLEGAEIVVGYGRVFDISKANTERFCQLVADNVPGSPLHQAILDAVSQFVQVNYFNDKAHRDNIKTNHKIILAACGGDKEKMAALMVARELERFS